MEYFNISTNLQEQEEDALSFRNLSFQKNVVRPDHDTISSLSEDDFEFTTTPTTTDSDKKIAYIDFIIFCGKVIAVQNHNSSTPKTTSFQKPRVQDPFSGTSESINKLRSTHSNGTATSSSSVWLPEIGRNRNQSSSSVQKHNVLFGLSKLPARMELSDIRKRQSRRSPIPMLGVGGGDKPVVPDGQSGGRGHWGLHRLRSKLASALASVSFGCIRHV